jgi:hypothetical protein
MKLREVKNPKDEHDFLKAHVHINRSYPNWIRPFDKDILEVFDPNKNRLLRTSKALRWVLENDKGQLIGRIAAFVNPKYKNKGDDVPVGGIGFFDCIDSQEAANLLFDTAKDWLATQGMQAMDGPINLGERDKWWGLLVEGFEPPIYSTNYNPPYYQRLFETYGFKVFFNQICWGLKVADSVSQLDPKFYEAHKKLAATGDFSVRHIRKSQLPQAAKDLSIVYNRAWAKHQGNKEISAEMALKMLKSMSAVMDEYLIWFAYHHDEPIAMWVNLPDINQIVKHLSGQFNLWAKLKFFLVQKFGKMEKFVGLIFGVVPEFQGKGVDYFMIVEAEKVIKAKTRYKDLELYWQGDFNPKMINISKNLGAKQTRRMVTYRYLFDPHKPFVRHPILD